MGHGAVLVALLGVIAFPRVARADEPPPDDYVEECTAERQCPGGRTCVAVRGKPSPECASAATGAGMEERCHSWGAMSSNVVFCAMGAERPASRRGGRGKGCGGCSGAGAGFDGGTLGGGSVIAIALAVAARRGARGRRRG